MTDAAFADALGAAVAEALDELTVEELSEAAEMLPALLLRGSPRRDTPADERPVLALIREPEHGYKWWDVLRFEPHAGAWRPYPDSLTARTHGYRVEWWRYCHECRLGDTPPAA